MTKYEKNVTFIFIYLQLLTSHSITGTHILFPHNSLRRVPTNSQVFFRGLLNMREKQIITSVIEIQKENWG